MALAIGACATPAPAAGPYSRTPQLVERPEAPSVEQAQVELELTPEEIESFRTVLELLPREDRRSLVSVLSQLDVGVRGRIVVRQILPQPEASRKVAAFLVQLGRDYEQKLAHEISMDPLRRWTALELASQSTEDQALVIEIMQLFAQGGRCLETEEDVARLRQSTPPDLSVPPVMVCHAEVAFLEDAWNDDLAYIINGKPAGDGEAPWQLQLTRAGKDQAYYHRPKRAREELDQLGRVRDNWERDHICGAVYIGKQFALTAAHCLDGWDGYEDEFFPARRIRAGASNIDGGGELIPISAVVTHKSYQEGKAYKGYDIALLVLEREPASPDTSRARIPLHPRNGQEPGAELILTGWGMTGLTENSAFARDLYGNPQESAQFLRIGNLKLYGNSECDDNAAFKQRNVKLGYGQICVGSKDGIDACKGDSGGPLVRMTDGAPPVLIGIVSWGVGCGMRGRSAIYTDVGTFYSWIKKAQLFAQPGKMIAIK